MASACINYFVKLNADKHSASIFLFVLFWKDFLQENPTKAVGFR
jgi:hypothetical protein